MIVPLDDLYRDRHAAEERKCRDAFYEIGIRHMTQKPIIHMQLVTENPPFDVNLYREIKFSRTRHSDVEKAKEELKLAVDASVLADGYQVTNPVTNARGTSELGTECHPRNACVDERN